MDGRGYAGLLSLCAEMGSDISNTRVSAAGLTVNCTVKRQQ